VAGLVAVEQVELELLLELSYEEFQKSVLSAGSYVVLWKSFSNAEDLAARFLKAKGKPNLADRRFSEENFAPEDLDLFRQAHSAAMEAQKYIEWAREINSGQPIYRNILVSYCVAFESCLKNVALVFLLATSKRRDLGRRVFIPGNEYRNTLSKVLNEWRNSQGDVEDFRAKAFFDRVIRPNNPDPARYAFDRARPESDSNWLTCKAAFDLRNVVVHQMGRPSFQIQVADSIFHPGWDVELKSSDLNCIAAAFRSILFPLSHFDSDF
jgi:hypothetical protein